MGQNSGAGMGYAVLFQQSGFHGPAHKNSNRSETVVNTQGKNNNSTDKLFRQASK